MTERDQIVIEIAALERANVAALQLAERTFDDPHWRYAAEEAAGKRDFLLSQLRRLDWSAVDQKGR